MALSFGNLIAPIVCGFLIQSEGWRWYEWVVSILAGANLLLIFFLAPETDYKRDLHKSIDSTGANSGDEETPTSAGPKRCRNRVKAWRYKTRNEGLQRSQCPPKAANVPRRAQTLVGNPRRELACRLHASMGDVGLPHVCLGRPIILFTCHCVRTLPMPDYPLVSYSH
jgi:hypothetical protein